MNNEVQSLQEGFRGFQDFIAGRQPRPAVDQQPPVAPQCGASPSISSETQELQKSLQGFREFINPQQVTAHGQKQATSKHEAAESRLRSQAMAIGAGMATGAYGKPLEHSYIPDTYEKFQKAVDISDHQTPWQQQFGQWTPEVERHLRDQAYANYLARVYVDRASDPAKSQQISMVTPKELRPLVLQAVQAVAKTRGSIRRLVCWVGRAKALPAG